MLAPFRCDVDMINTKRQIVQRKRNKVVALKGLRKLVMKYAFNSLVIEMNRLKETNCTQINASHVIVEIIAG